MISILHPSRSRPSLALHTFLTWKNQSTTPIEYILSLDQDDTQIQRYRRYFAGFIGIRIIINPNKSAVEAINQAAKVAEGNIFIVVSDDTECYPMWDTSLLEEIGDKKDFAMKTQDGIQEWIITMPILDREYYNRFGYVYCPLYEHMYVDTEFTCVAELLGRIFVSDLVFPHNHHSTKKGNIPEPDEVTAKADATFQSGMALFKERLARKFDLKEPVFDLPDNVYTRMK